MRYLIIFLLSILTGFLFTRAAKAESFHLQVGHCYKARLWTVNEVTILGIDSARAEQKYFGVYEFIVPSTGEKVYLGHYFFSNGRSYSEDVKSVFDLIYDLGVCKK